VPTCIATPQCELAEGLIPGSTELAASSSSFRAPSGVLGPTDVDGLKPATAVLRLLATSSRTAPSWERSSCMDALWQVLVLPKLLLYSF